jgi:hypothetical protein
MIKESHRTCLRRIERPMSWFPRNEVVLVLLSLAAIRRMDAQTSPPQNGQATFRSAQPRIVAPPANYHFPNGTTLILGAEWHVFNAGTATLKLERDGGSEKLTMNAATAGAVNLIFPVQDHFEARIDPATYCTTRIFKHAEEGKKKRETQIQIDPSRHVAVLDEKNLKTGETKHEENDEPACATDILSGFFYLGSLPLQPGSIESFPVTDGGKTTMASAQVEGREQIRVPAGTFPTVRVSMEATTGKLQGKGQLLVWFTDDAAHMPVQMRAKLQWGTVMFRLLRVEK